MKAQGLKWLALMVVLATGFVLVAPSAFAGSDSGYSAACKDGTSWTGKSKRGACRGHKGVQGWNSEAGAAASSEPEAKASHERKSRRSTKSEDVSAAHSASGEATGGTAQANTSRKQPATNAALESTVSATCKDGTSWTGKSKRGACRGHKGVSGWGEAATTAQTPSLAPPAAARVNNTPVNNMPVNNMAASTAAASPRRSATRTASTGGSLGEPAAGGGNGKVWVNTESKTYHCMGTKWYGTTKHGEYMSEAQATSKGFHADHGKACSR